MEQDKRQKLYDGILELGFPKATAEKALQVILEWEDATREQPKHSTPTTGDSEQGEAPKLPIEDKRYEVALERYLNEGIEYSANTIKNAAVDDLKQLAADSFCYGVQYAIDRYHFQRPQSRIKELECLPQPEAPVGFEEALEAELNKLPYTKHVDDGQSSA